MHTVAVYYKNENYLSYAQIWVFPCHVTTDCTDFDVLLTVHLSIFILVINQLDEQNFVLQ